TPAPAPAPTPQQPSPPAAAVAAVPDLTPAPATPASPSAPAAPSSGAGLLAAVTQAWQPNVLPTLKPMARALFSAGHFVSEAGGTVSFGLPNDTHRSRCESYRVDVEAAIAAQIGTTVKLSLVVDTSGPPDDHLATVVPLRKGAQISSAAVAAAESRARAEENEIDLSDLVDAPPEAMKSPADRLAEAFPGSVFVEDPR
ncbi:MAG: dnaX, partial [Ilumatobacteraceae bacterium]|nr:dnaX [Ilumatobacteraceae bacterium]